MKKSGAHDGIPSISRLWGSKNASLSGDYDSSIVAQSFDHSSFRCFEVFGAIALTHPTSSSAPPPCPDFVFASARATATLEDAPGLCFSAQRQGLYGTGSTDAW